jgi:glycosyltransferase involved in cell wall biosynthesis
MTVDEDGKHLPQARQAAVRWFCDVMAAAGLEGSYCLLLDEGETVGRTRPEARAAIAAAPALIDVMGFLGDEELLAAANLRVFLDVDPGFPHIWKELGLADAFVGYDRFVTVGGNIGAEDCLIPSCGRDWVTIRPPVDLDRWQAVSGPDEPTFRTVGSWRGPYAPVEFADRVLGLRAHEFRKFFDLPQRVPARFEVALDLDPADGPDREKLDQGGWLLLDPRRAVSSLGDYQEFIQGSSAEIGIAKSIYVETNSGWFSDRSACFLASGKPVLVQDTGFSRDLPVGDGLLVFNSFDEAVAGAEEIIGNQRRHAKAAREVAEENFDSRKVIGGLLEAVGAV